MSTKVISGEQGSVFQRWELPMVENVSGAVADAKEDKAPGLLTAEQIERIQNQAYKEAYDAGFQEGRQTGMATGQGEVDRKTQLLDGLLASLAQPLQELDNEVEQELTQLALAVARQLLRRELKADPGQVAAIVHEALAALPVGSREVRVCLHPDDAALVSEVLAQSEAERNWSLIDDPGLTRGDCRILTATSRIDATLERRLATVVAQLFGGEREQDAESPVVGTD
jgi:flagellar assembly protein FliH